MLQRVMLKGRSILKPLKLDHIANFASVRLNLLPDEHKRFDNPHIYKVGIGLKLLEVQEKIKNEIWNSL
jgi:nicotinate phosphoribosyltransferase